MQTLTGQQIVKLMRKHHITIRQAAEIFDIPQTTVRKRRASGVPTALMAWEWAIWLPQQHREIFR